MGLITRERAALQSTHPTQDVKLIIHHYLLVHQQLYIESQFLRYDNDLNKLI